jgi:thymidine phosphorylase
VSAVEAFDAVDLIRAKRDGHELETAEIDWLVDAYTRGYVADEQMSAMTMAIFLNGMTRREIRDLTMAMIASGERMDFSGLGKPTTDKHSTGGVGDKITLPLAPLVAACGGAVPQLSGRGLGHTGGTLDKLESIPGWRATLSNQELSDQLESVGAVICAAGAELAPADKKLYALRDVTGTVESIPLIASSIMSKKIAEGTGALVLDVKVGTGAFMKDLADARELASTMVALGQDAGVRTVALLTEMSTPLGLTAGNAIEVAESTDVLAGGGPDDVVQLTLALAREMLLGAGRGDVDPADRLADGSAMDVWKQMIRAQGGDPDAPLPQARESHIVTAPASGVLTRLDALSVGTAAWRLGAGRARKEDPVQAGAGVIWHARPGGQVTAGQPLFTLLTDDAPRIARALESLEGGYDIAAPGTSYEPTPLILVRITLRRVGSSAGRVGASAHHLRRLGRHLRRLGRHLRRLGRHLRRLGRHLCRLGGQGRRSTTVSATQAGLASPSISTV